MSTISAAVEATLARRDADELAALRTAKAEEGLAYRLELAALRAEIDRIYALPGVAAQGDRSDVPDAVEALITHHECQLTEAERLGAEIGREEMRADLTQAAKVADDLRIAAESKEAEFSAALVFARETVEALTEERDAARHASVEVVKAGRESRAELVKVINQTAAERDTLRAQRDAAVEALENVVKACLRGDSDATKHGIARDGLLLARGTP